MRLRQLLMGTAMSLLPALAGAPVTALASPAGGGTSAADPQSHVVKEIVVTARRLDQARETIQPDVGASTYVLPSAALQLMPGGDNAQLNEVVLQMPGVAEDSYGQLHVRGEHADLQYRFNGVILPEGLSFFGQAISPRIASSIELVTGALPAEYGLRTAGIVEIRTKTGLKTGGTVGLYGGSHGEWEPSIDYGGSSGANTFFGSASYMQNELGIESPDGRSTPRHDRTNQAQAFGYFDHVISEESRLSVFGGVSDQSFQIPNRSGQQPAQGYQFAGQTAFPSEDLNARQKEFSAFLAGSYLFSRGDFTGHAAVFTRYSSLTYRPDVLGELLYNGVAEAAQKDDLSLGFQTEGAWTLGHGHTVRSGLIFEADRSNSAVTAQAFRADTNPASPTYGQAIYRDPAGNNIAETIYDDGSANAQTYSLYLQDEWRLADNFTLNYGLRFDQLNAYRRENQLSPRLNFLWTPFANTTIHGGFARYFSPPPFELVASASLAKFSSTVNYPFALHQALPGQALDDLPRSERSNYFDLGIQQKLPHGFTAGLDTYLKASTHLVDEGQFGEAIILTPFNYAHGKDRGAELTLGYAGGPLTAYWNLNYNRSQGRGVESSQFNFSPEELTYIANTYIFLDHNETWSSSFGAAYRFGASHVSLDGVYGSGLRATGANGIPNGEALPAHVVFNLSLLEDLKLPGAGPLQARLDVVNLFDKVYQIRNGSGVGVGAPQFGARRGVFVGLTKSF